ncbi:hypothetical protein CK203_078652 [Vitis vinifera]|uniref:Uncharacterized protein n=1 Tax=Vitis vinifera TaxID=29760 RepID=A0A438C3K8_VITVI|nr:hypothetical protein CK203_078652 [Vitis vinifera]
MDDSRDCRSAGIHYMMCTREQLFKRLELVEAMHAFISQHPGGIEELRAKLEKVEAELAAARKAVADGTEQLGRENLQLKRETDELLDSLAAQKKESEDLREGLAAQKEKMEARFAAQKKEMEEEYQKQADEMYFFGYRCCMKKHGIMHDIPSFLSDEEDTTPGAVFLKTFMRTNVPPLKLLGRALRLYSTFASPCRPTSIRIVGRPISVGMTTSIPYARAKGVFPVGHPDVKFRTEIPESDAIKLRVVISYNGLRDSKATDDVLPYELGDVFVLDASGETGGLYSDLMCLPGFFGQSSYSEIPYYDFRPFLAVCLARLNSIASGGFCDGGGVSYFSQISRHAFIFGFVFLLDVSYHELGITVDSKLGDR